MFASAFAVSSSYSAEQEASARDSSIIVAVDRDKNSQQAAKWAVDKLLSRGSTLTLVHVRGRHLFRIQPLNAKCMSFSKVICKSQMHLKEVILDNSDISKAIIDYATNNAITDIVVGASTKNTFIRYITCLLHFHGCTPFHSVNAYTDNSHDHYTLQKI